VGEIETAGAEEKDRRPMDSDGFFEDWIRREVVPTGKARKMKQMLGESSG